MPFVLPEDVGTTKRRKMTPTRALAAWERTKGRCVLCGHPIDGTRDVWFVEHVRALELGGSDTDDNLGPAHVRCKPTKDAEDHSRAAKAKRVKREALGITKAFKRGPKIRSRGFPKRERTGPDKLAQIRALRERMHGE